MKINERELSDEWVELVKDAIRSNITKENFKKFLKEQKEKRENNNKPYV